LLGIRAARESDLEAILDIYNHAVVNTTATFDLIPRSMESQVAWFADLEGVGFKFDRRLNVAISQHGLGS
jgi:L-amino acid N-acyltransferase